MQAVFTAIIDALKAGYGVAVDFGTMVKDTFTSVFLETTTSGGSTTITGLSSFGAVALVMIGIATVTGLGMLIFRRFFGRT